MFTASGFKRMVDGSVAKIATFVRFVWAELEIVLQFYQVIKGMLLKLTELLPGRDAEGQEGASGPSQGVLGLFSTNNINFSFLAWAAIVIRNTYISQEVHDWAVADHPLMMDQVPAPDSAPVKNIVTVLPSLSQRYFAMIVIILSNKLYRHERGLL